MTTNLTLQETLAATVLPDGARQHTIADNWLQGRSGFGGLTTTLSVAALMEASSPGRALRSVQVVFVAPTLAGTTTITAEMLRSGKSVETLTARMVNAEGAVTTMVTGVFGGAREALTYPLPKHDTLPEIKSLTSSPYIKGLTPDFLENIETKWMGNGIPFSGSEEWSLSLWARLRQSDGVPKLLRYLVMADTHPSAILSHFKAPIMQSSVTWGLEIVKPLDQAVGDWMFIDATLIAAADGYCQQSTSFYDEAGDLIMLGQQCMAYFG